MKTNTMLSIAMLSVAILLAGCSSNDDEGNVSGDFLQVTDVVLNGNLSSTTLHIEADCSWRISEETSWLTVSPTQGSGTMDVELTTGVNPSSVEERSCELTVTSDGGVTRVVKLSQTQTNESMDVSTRELSFGEDGGKLAFTVTSNTTWAISGGADWLSLSDTKGADNGSIDVSVQSNAQEMERSAVLTVTGNAGTAIQITIKQVGKTVNLTIEPERIEAAAKGKTYSFSVMGNADWTVAADVTTWVTVEQRSGSGDGTVSFTVADNTGSVARTANIRVTSSSGRVERTCVVTQLGATVPQLTPPTFSGTTRYETTVQSSFDSSLDVTECGFCYATTANPTVNDQSVTVSGPTGMSGSLQSQLSGLTSGQTYHVRAWARNANGIGYSADTTVTTEGKLPNENENPTPNI